MSLSRRILRQVLLVAGGASLLFAVLFLGLYREQLARERAVTAEQINQLLRVVLENAMLKRDVEGLRDIVQKMGQQPGIARVMILAPDGEVRFASAAADLGQRLPQLLAMPGLPAGALGDAGEVLRSVNLVPNQPACVGCHGAVAQHPLNGVLVVDYDAGTIHQAAFRSALLFAAAGIAVLALTLWSVWRLLRRRLMDPLADLDQAANALAAGDLAVRAAPGRNDELGRLAGSFNRMAAHLAEQINDGLAQQRYLQELLDGLPDGVRVIRQRDYRIVAVNAAYCTQMGVSAAATLGQFCHRSSHQRDLPCVATMVVCPLNELRQPGQTLRCRHRHLRADGREVPVEVHAALLERAGPDGRENLVIESIVDLSQAVRFSQEQRLSELGLLAAGIAHEIHNPLGSMRLAVDGLLRGLRKGDDQPQRMLGYLEMMSAEIDRCSGVTQRLLLLSRPPVQQAQLVDLNRAVADTVLLLDFDASSHRIIQRLELDPAGPRVLADDSDLRMLVLNLVQNAHHAMPAGGELLVRTRQQGSNSLIEVIDAGCGIDEAVLPKIFDPFYSRRADSDMGTGLGLTICKTIVDRYGGRIEVASSAGKGSTFSVILPSAGE